MTTEQSKELLRSYFLKVASGQAVTMASVKRVSSSGMSRCIAFTGIINNPDGTPETVNLTWHINNAGIYKLDKNIHGLRVSGCGMDMIFEVLYQSYRAVKEPSDPHYNKTTKYNSL